MKTKVQTVHFANNGTDALDVSYDILDDAGQPVKPQRSQFTASPELVAMLVAECQAHADEKVSAVADATVRAALVGAALKTLDDTKAAVAAEDASLAAKRAEAKAVDAELTSKRAEVDALIATLAVADPVAPK